MAGHSKWAGIKHKKAALDAKRAKRWTRLVREVIVAARLGGGDPNFNPRLRNAVQDAKADNVPNDNIDRAIKKGTGELEGESYEELTYEGYAPHGVAVILEVMTDNRNRTVSEVRHLFSKNGGNLGENGCVAWMFDRRGFFTIPNNALDEDGLMELAIELEAEDFTAGDPHEIYTAADDYGRIREALEEREIPMDSKQLAMIPQNSVALDIDTAPTVIRLLEALEDHDDVQAVWSNFDVDDEVLAALSV